MYLIRRNKVILITIFLFIVCESSKKKSPAKQTKNNKPSKSSLKTSRKAQKIKSPISSGHKSPNHSLIRKKQLINQKKHNKRTLQQMAHHSTKRYFKPGEEADKEAKGPISYFIHPGYYNRFHDNEAFNRWFIDLWKAGRFTQDYDYSLIDTNHFIGKAETVGTEISDSEAVRSQNFEQHLQHLQKVLKEEQIDQEMMIQFSRERTAMERMLKFRETRNRIYESVILMEKVLYSEQDDLANNLQKKLDAKEKEEKEKIAKNMESLVLIPHFPMFPNKTDVFAN